MDGSTPGRTLKCWLAGGTFGRGVVVQKRPEAFGPPVVNQVAAGYALPEILPGYSLPLPNTLLGFVRCSSTSSKHWGTFVPRHLAPCYAWLTITVCGALLSV